GEAEGPPRGTSGTLTAHLHTACATGCSDEVRSAAAETELSAYSVPSAAVRTSPFSPRPGTTPAPSSMNPPRRTAQCRPTWRGPGSGPTGLATRPYRTHPQHLRERCRRYRPHVCGPSDVTRQASTERYSATVRSAIAGHVKCSSTRARPAAPI